MKSNDAETKPVADTPAPANAGTPPAPEAAAEPQHEDEKKSKWPGLGKKDKAVIEELTKARDEAEHARATLQDRLLRLQADFENFRKRTARERVDLIRTANEDLVLELLPAVDNFELALDSAKGGGSQDALLQGVRLVREQLVAALTKFGLTALEAGGQTFDPTRHEAISQLPSETVPENGVIVQTRRGYLLGDKLIRPAQVVVSSGKPGGDAPAAGA